MAQTFQARIEDIVGDTVSGGDLGLSANMLGDWFNDGLNEVIMRLPERVLKSMSTTTAFGTSGTTVENARILSVVRNDGSVNRQCSEVPYEVVGQLSDTASFYEAKANFPFFYREPQSVAGVLIKVAPAASASGTGATLVKVSLPSVTIATGTSITGWPNELEDLPVWWAAAQALLRESGWSRRKAQTEIETITSSGILSNFSNAMNDAESALVNVTVQLSALISTDLVAFDTAIADSQTDFDKAVSILGGASPVTNAVADILVATSATSPANADAIQMINDDKLEKAQKSTELAVARIQEAAGHVQAGSAKVSEGMAQLGKSDKRFQGYVQEAQARLAKAQSYLQEAQTRLGTAGSFVTTGNNALSEHNALHQKFENRLNQFIQGRS